MPKYNVNRRNTNARIRRKRQLSEDRLNRKLAKRQSMKDRIKNIEAQAEYIEELKELNKLRNLGDIFIEDNISEIPHEEIKQETNFLRQLVLETSILKAGGKSTQKRLSNPRTTHLRNIKKLKTEYDFFKDAIKQQQRELKKCKDKRNVKVIKKFIENLEKKQAVIKEKLDIYRKLLIKKTK
ncbi:MAG TPA: hypothetical protein P5530_04245 [Candidatus Diapherotrites archaeon]|jgi:cell division protein FtsB|nr:hypothetical protein [Candidatus Diapherotrites archaeon]